MNIVRKIYEIKELHPIVILYIRWITTHEIVLIGIRCLFKMFIIEPQYINLIN